MIIGKYWSKRAYLFCQAGGLQGKKKIDYDKASIQMILEPPSIRLDIDTLITTKQYSTTFITRVLDLRSNVSLGEFSRLIVDTQFSLFKFHENFDRMTEFTRNFWRSEDLEGHMLHYGSFLQNFLKVLSYLQQNTKWEFVRYFLGFLSYYAEKSELINSKQRLQLVWFITQRCYFTHFIVQEIKNLFVVSPVVGQDHAENELLSLIYRIGILKNVIKAQAKEVIEESPELRASEILRTHLELLIETLSSNLEVIMKMEPRLWMFEELFDPEHKPLLFRILKDSFGLMSLHSIQYHPEFFKVVFDKLLMFSTLSDRVQITQLLDQFELILSVFTFVDQDETVGPSLILLCEKFEYTSNTIADYFYKSYLQKRFFIHSQYRIAHFHKNKIYNRNLMIMCCNCLAVCEKVSGKINPDWRALFINKFELLLDVNLYDFPGIQSYLYKANVASDREAQNNSNIAQSFNYLTGQFYFQFSSEDSQKLHQLEKEMGVQYSQEDLEDFTYAVNEKTSNATRVKVMFWNLYYYTSFSQKKSRPIEIYRYINENATLVKHIANYIAYPSLFEGVINFIVEVETLSSKPADSHAKNHLNIMINQQKARFNAACSSLGQLRGSNIHLDNIYRPYLEFLQSPYCCKVLSYHKDSQIEESVKSSVQKIIQSRNSPLWKRVKQQLTKSSNRSPRNMNLKVSQFHFDYPHFADFLISFRNRNILVLVVPHENEAQIKRIENFRNKKSTEDIRKIFMSFSSYEE